MGSGTIGDTAWRETQGGCSVSAEYLAIMMQQEQVRNVHHAIVGKCDFHPRHARLNRTEHDRPQPCAEMCETKSLSFSSKDQEGGIFSEYYLQFSMRLMYNT